MEIMTVTYDDIRPGLHTYKQIPCGKTQGRNGRIRILTKGESYIKTKLGEIPEAEWTEKAYKAVEEHGDLELLKRIKEHVKTNCAWLKPKDILPYSLECLLIEAFRAWDEFKETEILFLL